MGGSTRWRVCAVQSGRFFFVVLTQVRNLDVVFFFRRRGSVPALFAPASGGADCQRRAGVVRALETRRPLESLHFVVVICS